MDQTIRMSNHRRRVAEHLVECGTLISTLGSADALVFVGLDDYPATVFCDLHQDEPLVFGRLVVAAHAQVDRSTSAISAHSSARPSL